MLRSGAVGSVADAIPPPVADFTGAGKDELPRTAEFTDSSIGTPTEWLWEKNDGGGWASFDGEPTAQNPVEVFEPGFYSIRLTVTNAGGSDTLTRTDYLVVPVDPAAPTLDAQPQPGEWTVSVSQAFGGTTIDFRAEANIENYPDNGFGPEQPGWNDLTDDPAILTNPTGATDVDDHVWARARSSLAAGGVYSDWGPYLTIPPL